MFLFLNAFIIGLPWTTTEEQIEEFFGSEVEITEGGIHLITNRSGRPSGIAYVEFKDPAHALRALEKNDSHLGRCLVFLPTNTTKTYNSEQVSVISRFILATKVK